MYAQISKKVRVWITNEEITFLQKYREHKSFTSEQLAIDDVNTAKILSDKSILVRKKLDNGTQYAFNRYIRIFAGDPN